MSVSPSGWMFVCSSRFFSAPRGPFSTRIGLFDSFWNFKNFLRVRFLILVQRQPKTRAQDYCGKACPSGLRRWYHAEGRGFDSRPGQNILLIFCQRANGSPMLPQHQKHSPRVRSELPNCSDLTKASRRSIIEIAAFHVAKSRESEE